MKAYPPFFLEPSSHKTIKYPPHRKGKGQVGSLCSCRGCPASTFHCTPPSSSQGRARGSHPAPSPPAARGTARRRPAAGAPDHPRGHAPRNRIRSQPDSRMHTIVLLIPFPARNSKGLQFESGAVPQGHAKPTRSLVGLHSGDRRRKSPQCNAVEKASRKPKWHPLQLAIMLRAAARQIESLPPQAPPRDTRRGNSPLSQGEPSVGAPW